MVRGCLLQTCSAALVSKESAFGLHACTPLPSSCTLECIRQRARVKRAGCRKRASHSRPHPGKHHPVILDPVPGPLIDQTLQARSWRARLTAQGSRARGACRHPCHAVEHGRCSRARDNAFAASVQRHRDMFNHPHGQP